MGKANNPCTHKIRREGSLKLFHRLTSGLFSLFFRRKFGKKGKNELFSSKWIARKKGEFDFARMSSRKKKIWLLSDKGVLIAQWALGWTIRVKFNVSDFEYFVFTTLRGL